MDDKSVDASRPDVNCLLALGRQIDQIEHAVRIASLLVEAGRRKLATMDERHPDFRATVEATAEVLASEVRGRRLARATRRVFCDVREALDREAIRRARRVREPRHAAPRPAQTPRRAGARRRRPRARAPSPDDGPAARLGASS